MSDDFIIRCTACALIFYIHLEMGEEETEDNPDPSPQYCPYCGSGPDKLEDATDLGNLSRPVLKLVPGGREGD